MKNAPFLFSRIACFVVLPIMLAACGQPALPEQRLQTERTFPPVKLRGYGTVEGLLKVAPDRQSSILEITCEDEGKARLLQAKYLSDLYSLPGVEAESSMINGVEVSVQKVISQGVIAAMRSGTKVSIAIGYDKDALSATLQAVFGKQLKDVASRAEVEVPMWLNRWDRFGFRFYYRPWELPPKTASQDYDFEQEFVFAEKSDRAGFVMWEGREPVDSAGGMMRGPWWDWALELAKERNLPVGINSVINSEGASSFFNRYRDELAQKMPQFSGNTRAIADPSAQANGVLSWSSTNGKDVALAELQKSLRKIMSSSANITSVLEPHDELYHGKHDMFLEYGPLADSTFRSFLEKKYGGIDALNKAWETSLTSWDEVRVPEVASFAGWGEGAIDLRGEWKVAHEPFADGVTYTKKELSRLNGKIVETKGAPAEWFAEAFDDSGWPSMTAPGNDVAMFVDARPAVFRTTFDLPSEWMGKKAWLYVWDLNLGTGEKVVAYVNGQKVGEDIILHYTPHWGAFEVTKALRAGKNQISLRLPRGRMAYRVYLSQDEPKQYPDLGRGANARWVDFTSWLGWSRVENARRGMEMIRQVDPNVQIDLMAPDHYANEIRRLAAEYGGNFKNTGHMGAFWADYLPSLMRGARLPFSLEPGWPAPDPDWFKRHMGLYATEGIQGIDYFIHVGSILWREPVRKYFEENLSQIRFIGKYHTPPAEVAALYPSTIDAKTGFPWGFNPNVNVGSGYWNWNVRAYLMGLYESDGLTESSFEDGEASRYRVIIDTNTSIMDDRMIGEIENYVRNGGTFVTFVQTGRHTPVDRDAWPISQLTGFRVTHIDPLNEKGDPIKSRGLKPAPNQDVFTSGDWSQVKANGLSLEPVTPDAIPLMLWADGSVAIGMRKLGEGYVIQVGPKFGGRGMPDRLPGDASQNHQIPQGAAQSLTHLLSSILEWRGVKQIEAHLNTETQQARFRHYLTNNGLYDAWVVWNQSAKDPLQGHILFGPDPTTFPKSAFDLKEGRDLTISEEGLAFNLPPLEFRVWLTPRKDGDAFLHSAANWFALQRDWWRMEAADPFGKPLVAQEYPHAEDLREGWAFLSLAADPTDDQIRAWNTLGFDDSAWRKIPFGVWPARGEMKTTMLRREFSVPDNWSDGVTTFWMQSWMEPTFVDEARVWIDGNLVRDWSEVGIRDYAPSGGFVPGSKHVVTVEVRSKGSMAGARSNVWLAFWPKAKSILDLSGEWQPSQDMLNYQAAIPLPGPYKAFGLRRSIQIPEERKGDQVYVDAVLSGRLIGVLINGHWVRRFHHDVDPHMHLNITPWVKFGEENEIQLVSVWSGEAEGKVESVRLEFHDKDPASKP